MSLLPCPWGRLTPTWDRFCGSSPSGSSVDPTDFLNDLVFPDLEEEAAVSLRENNWRLLPCTIVSGYRWGMGSQTPTDAKTCMLKPLVLKRCKAASPPPLIGGGEFQDPQWKPETVDGTEPRTMHSCTYLSLSLIYESGTQEINSINNTMEQV